MPKVSGPLMSMQASGLIGERLIFSKRGSGQQARFQRAQKDRTTAGRTIQRALYAAAVAAWNNLDDDIKEIYRDLSLLLDMTGYNLFIKLHINGEILDSDFAYYGNRNYGVFHYGKTL
jgi:hypothetical protein